MLGLDAIKQVEKTIHEMKLWQDDLLQSMKRMETILLAIHAEMAMQTGLLKGELPREIKVIPGYEVPR